jgi:cytochrome oxidase Cu insertion factor (SCO1/SenC/PrrC family)
MSTRTKWKKYIGLAGMLFLFPLLWLVFFGVLSKHKFKTLSYLGPENTLAEDPHYRIPDFAFADEIGNILTRDSMLGKVWVAACYSTSDEHIAQITERLLNINFKYRNEPDIAIVVFSTRCESDTPESAKAYIDQNTQYNGFGNKWKYLTGNQDAMQAYIRNGLLIQDLSNEAIFKLIDADGHIRGEYGNTEYHFLGGAGDSIPGMVQDIALLKKEIDIRRYNERKAKEAATTQP